MTHLLDSRDGIGAGELITDEDGCRDPVFAAKAGITFAGKLGARNVLHSQDRPVRKSTDNHVLEFGRIRKPALDVHRVLELRAGFGWRLSDLPGGRYKVLLIDYVG